MMFTINPRIYTHARDSVESNSRSDSYIRTKLLILSSLNYDKFFKKRDTSIWPGSRLPPCAESIVDR